MNDEMPEVSQEDAHKMAVHIGMAVRFYQMVRDGTHEQTAGKVPHPALLQGMQSIVGVMLGSSPETVDRDVDQFILVASFGEDAIG